MITSISMHVGSSTEEREAFDSLKVAANATNTKYYIGTDFATVYDLLPGETVDVSFDTYVEIDGADPLIIYQGTKQPRGFREGLQSALTSAQMAAVNSGVTAEKVGAYDELNIRKFDKAKVVKKKSNYSAPIEDDEDDFVPSYGRTEKMINENINNNNLQLLPTLQPKLTDAQLAAVNSGITNLKVAGYNSAKAKADASCKARKDIDLTAKHCITVSGDPAVVTRTRADVSGGNVFALTSELFRMKREVDCSIYFGYEATNYDYYFAFHADGKWVLTKEFTSEVKVVISTPGFSFGDDEEESGNEQSQSEQSQSEQSQSTADTVKGATVQEATPLNHYTGQPLCCVVAMRKDRQNLTESDIEALTGHKVYIEIEASRSQDIDVMLEQFNPHPWEVKNYDTRAELSAEFEVFPTFEQGGTESENGYPEGYDHYFAVNIDKASGNEVYNFRRFAKDPDDIEGEKETNFIRIILDSVSQYNQDFYIPIGSEIDVQEGTQLLAYINEYPEDTDEKDVIVSIQNGCIIHASIDIVELDAEVAEEEGQLISGGGTATITPTDKDPNDAPVNP